eukprot:TRINITY_DN67031_c5_g2_i1.p1 TRINITY_DN67031_c5_g2~~TRINITY_DN67031_c5_g2_i1.p1  ORF type:complete len:354 (-),score=46.39 TRINITY_DN67031_c5_g2_i1:512-1573(-)
MYTVSARWEKAHCGEGVWAIALHEDGRIMTGGVDGTVNTWACTNSQNFSLKSSSTSATAVVHLATAGDVLASTLMDGTILLTDTRTGEILDSIANDPGCSWQASVYSTGDTVAVGCGSKGVLLYHVPSKNKQFLATPAFCTSVYFDPSGSWLVAGCRNGKVVLWETSEDATGTGNDTKGVGIRAEERGVVGCDHSAAVAVAISRDAQWLAVAHASGSVVIWHILQKELFTEFSHSSTVEATAKPIGRQDGAEAEETVPEQGQPQDTTVKKALKVIPPTSVAFAPSGPYCAVGFKDGKVKIFHITVRECLWTFTQHSKAVSGLEYNSYEDVLYSVGDDGVVVSYNTQFPNVLNL